MKYTTVTATFSGTKEEKASIEVKRLREEVNYLKNKMARREDKAFITGFAGLAFILFTLHWAIKGLVALIILIK